MKYDKKDYIIRTDQTDTQESDNRREEEMRKKGKLFRPAFDAKLDARAAKMDEEAIRRIEEEIERAMEEGRWEEFDFGESRSRE